MMTERFLRDRLQLFSDLRRDTLILILALAWIAAQSWILFVSLYMRMVLDDVFVLCLVIELICGVSFWLQNRHLQLATHILIIGLWLCNVWASLHFDAGVFLYLFSLITLVASSVTNRGFTLLVTVASSLVMVVLRSDGESDWTAIPPLVATWLTMLISLTTRRSLYQALDMAWNYQDYAVRQMQEARDHRAELMKLTKALKEARDDLVHANIQLRHARHAAEEARRLKAQFAANVSHEFRTPINLIVGFCEVMVSAPQAYGTPLPAAYWEDIYTLHQSARHLRNLINDVLDMSQIEAGQMAVVKEEANPRQILLEATEMTRDLIESKGLTFAVSLPDTLPKMLLDRTRIRQVFLNLLGNAVRFTDQGAVTLQATIDKDWLHISVSDTGIGIPTDQLDRVFEEFHQLETSLSRRYGGSGLGLTLSRQFVEMHGGRLWAESEGIPGKGSTFTVRLPLAGHVTSHEHMTRTSNPDNDARYFVVFDDDPAIGQLFERYAKKHRAIAVQRREEALHLVNTIHPTALIIGDNQMDEQLRQIVDVDWLSTPIISCPMPSGRREMQQHGVADYLVKPVSYEDLLGALSRLAQPVESALIIDDDQDIVRMFSRMLQAVPGIGQIWKAYSGEEGLALMHHQRPDVVILDLLMPDVDGFMVIHQMKNDLSLRDIPILLASARGAVDAIMPTVRGSLSVRKPTGFQPIELVRCVEALVDTFNPSVEPAL